MVFLSSNNCGGKSLANKDYSKFGGKNFGELKSICIGNVTVMEIVELAKT